MPSPTRCWSPPATPARPSRRRSMSRCGNAAAEAVGRGKRLTPTVPTVLLPCPSHPMGRSSPRQRRGAEVAVTTPTPKACLIPRPPVHKLTIDDEADKPNPRDSWPAWTNDVAFWPTEADAEWAAANLNDGDGHTDDPTPDEVYDQRAAESLALDRMERGLRCF